MNTIKYRLTLVKAMIFIAFLFGLFIALPQISSASTSGATTTGTSGIDNWWPVDGISVSGTQPFKATLPGFNISQYQMFWQVDGGSWVWMDNNYTDYPHKQAMVNLSSWNWRGSGPYAVTYIARYPNGTIIATKTIHITIQNGVAVTTPVPTYQNTSPSTVSTPSPTTTTTATVATVTQPITTSVIATVAPVSAPTPTPTPTPTLASTPAPVTVSPSSYYVDPQSQAEAAVQSLQASQPANAAEIAKIANQPQAKWLGAWSGDVYTTTKNYTDSAANAGQQPIFVAYNIPNRDCGGYSQGGATDATSYLNWIKNIALAIGNRQATVILEPDSVALTTCLSASDLSARYSMLNQAVSALKASGSVSVYIDAGHPYWINPTDMANRLQNAGIAKANGFSLNVSNFYTTAENQNYGLQISSALANAGLSGHNHFAIDTSRNGNGSNGEWCNPSGRALGAKPTNQTGNSSVDAFLWLKRPGESDGTCNGGPSAGSWWSEYALGLAQRAVY